MAGQSSSNNIPLNPDTNVFVNSYPPIKLYYSSEWTISIKSEEVNSKKGINPNILIRLEIQPTSEAPSLGPVFILSIDSTYDKSIIKDEKSYLIYLKNQMIKEYPFMFNDTLKSIIIDSTLFLNLTSYASFMGHFIQTDYAICLFKGVFIIVVNIFNNEDDKKKLVGLLSRVKIGAH